MYEISPLLFFWLILIFETLDFLANLINLFLIAIVTCGIFTEGIQRSTAVCGYSKHPLQGGNLSPINLIPTWPLALGTWHLRTQIELTFYSVACNVCGQLSYICAVHLCHRKSYLALTPKLCSTFGSYMANTFVGPS